MSSSFHYCLSKKLISPPDFIKTNLHYEVIMGSRAYGVNENEKSDYDIYGFCMPPKSVVFPHQAGYLLGFDKDYPKFEQYHQVGVICPFSAKEFDFTIFGIVRYFELLCENNPNILDSLFVPEFCIKHITQVGQLVRDNRKMFLSKECWKKYRGYAVSQFHKLESKNPEGKRLDLVEKYGYDTKFAYHIIRLMKQAEEVLETGDLNLTKNNDELKAIRRGEWTLDRLKKEFEQRKLAAEEVYRKSTLQILPDRVKIKQLLLQCLEIHYGNLSDECIVRKELPITILQNIDKELSKIRGLL